MKNRLIASTLGRRARARSAVLAVVVGAAVFALPTASWADDSYFTDCLSSRITCQTGTEVAGAGDADRCELDVSHNTTVCVKYDGDIVYVLDGEPDGNSALGRIDTSAGSVDQRYCRNPHGVGTWAQCNFDWVEATTHRVYGGVRYTNTSSALSLLWTFSNN